MKEVPAKIRKPNSGNRALRIVFLIAIIAVCVSAVIKIVCANLSSTLLPAQADFVPPDEPPNSMRLFYILDAISALVLSFSVGVVIVCAFLLERQKAMRQKTIKFPWISLCAILVLFVQTNFITGYYVIIYSTGLGCMPMPQSDYQILPFLELISRIADIILGLCYYLILALTIWILCLKLSKKNTQSTSP